MFDQWTWSTIKWWQMTCYMKHYNFCTKGLLSTCFLHPLLLKAGADLERVPLARTPSYFCRDRGTPLIFAETRCLLVCGHPGSTASSESVCAPHQNFLDLPLKRPHFYFAFTKWPPWYMRGDTEYLLSTTIYCSTLCFNYIGLLTRTLHPNCNLT